MGLLSQGSPLSWEETQRHADHVRLHGILQFLHIYHAVKDRHKDVLKWGDEVSARAPGPRRPAPLCSARPLRPQSAPCAALRVPAAPPRVPAEPAGVQRCPGPCSEPLAGLLSPIHSFGVRFRSASAE